MDLHEHERQVPDGEAAGKLAAYVAVTAQILEAVLRARQRRVEQGAAADSQAGAAARSARTADHAGDRLRWARLFDPRWRNQDPSGTFVEELGDAVLAADRWAGYDPGADVALRRAQTVLTRLAPDTMAAHERLVAQGRGWLDSLRDLHGYLDDELARRHGIRIRAEPAEPGGGRGRERWRPPRPAAQPAPPRPDEPPGTDRRAAQQQDPATPDRAGPRGPEWFRVDNAAWLREASVAKLTRMWEAALRASKDDIFAASAAARLGDRLAHVHPAGASAVAGYQAAHRQGRGHDAAFHSALQILDGGKRPNVVDGEVVDRLRPSAPGRASQQRPQTRRTHRLGGREPRSERLPPHLSPAAGDDRNVAADGYDLSL